MREILFRGKRVDNEQWVDGCCLCLYGEETLHIIVDEHGQYHRVDPETVGQFTGWTDKNGKKIFEGDLVAFGEYRKAVEWKEDRLGFGYVGEAWRMLECDGGHCEIIGNIHDNPELLD